MFSNVFISNQILSKCSSEHYAKRYLSFISKFSNTGGLVRHHILPRGEWDEFACFKENPWNEAKLTHRQHFVAHWLLHKAIGLSQTYAFWAMINKDKQHTTSRTYSLAMEAFSKAISEDKARGQKISRALSGTPKSKECIAKGIETKQSEHYLAEVEPVRVAKFLQAMDYVAVGKKQSQTKNDPEWKATKGKQQAQRISRANAGRKNKAQSSKRKLLNSRPIVQTIRELAQKHSVSLGRNWWAKSDEELELLRESFKATH